MTKQDALEIALRFVQQQRCPVGEVELVVDVEQNLADHGGLESVPERLRDRIRERTAGRFVIHFGGLPDPEIACECPSGFDVEVNALTGNVDWVKDRL